MPEAIVEAVTLHYLSGEIDIELSLSIEILQNINGVKYLEDELRQAVSSLFYIQ